MKKMQSNRDREAAKTHTPPGPPGRPQTQWPRAPHFRLHDKGGAAAVKQRAETTWAPRRPRAPLEGRGGAGHGRSLAEPRGGGSGAAPGPSPCELGEPEAEPRLSKTGKRLVAVRGGAGAPGDGSGLSLLSPEGCWDERRVAEPSSRLHGGEFPHGPNS